MFAQKLPGIDDHRLPGLERERAPPDVDLAHSGDRHLHDVQVVDALLADQKILAAVQMDEIDGDVA
jgi:hypothetical protein